MLTLGSLKQLTFLQSLFAAGFLLMGATAEQMSFIDSSSMDHVSYILVLLSVTCIFFLFTNVLVHIYDRHASDRSNREITTKDYLDEYDAENGHDRASDDLDLRGLIKGDMQDENRHDGVQTRGESSESFELSSTSTAGKKSQPFA
jgi:hypothetical protein